MSDLNSIIPRDYAEPTITSEPRKLMPWISLTINAIACAGILFLAAIA